MKSLDSTMKTSRLVAHRASRALDDVAQSEKGLWYLIGGTILTLSVIGILVALIMRPEPIRERPRHFGFER